MTADDKQRLPEQSQRRQPGIQSQMDPEPETIRTSYRGSGRLAGRVAVVTGGDSGIGRAVAVHFAREGADVCIAYLDEHDDAKESERLVRDEGRDCLLFAGDLGHDATCRELVDAALERFGRIDILVNNAAEQHTVERVEDLEPETIERTFRTNILACLSLCRHAVPHLRPGSAIINTSSVTARKGHQQLLDYSATKGALLALTASLAARLAGQGIRVNAVAPGPIWTPLIPASFEPEQVAEFGRDTPLGRPGQPSEVAPAYVYLASEEASYMTGQTLHINGGGYFDA